MRCANVLMACAVVVMISAAGCKSISSTALNRRSNDLLVNDCKSTSGVPIRIKVPSHFQVHITETFMMQNEGSNKKWEIVKVPQPLLNVETNLRYTDKIFTVDFKRPAAGTSKYGAEFTDEQYFASIQHELEDKTIAETSAAIGNLIGAISKAAGGATVTPPANANIFTGTRTVAWAEFDINDPGFEEQVQAFVHHHVNCCHSCANPPVSADAMYPTFVPGQNCPGNGDCLPLN